MNFFVRKILGRHFSPAEWANFLVKETAESAGKVFNDKLFQKQVRMQELEEEEQNRIFNEVQATGITFVILLVENRVRYVADGREAHWREVIEKIPEIFCQWLEEIGIPREFVLTWGKLIDLRLDEYRQGIFETADAFERQNGERGDDARMAYLRLETVAALSMMHITRGKARPGDPLQRHLMTWLGVLESNIVKNIE